MRAPALIRQIRDEMKIIDRAVITDESDDMERRWEVIKEEIITLARMAKTDSDARKNGFRECFNSSAIECIDCGVASNFGDKKCRECGQKFRYPKGAK